jgi:hypothetical protein
MNSNKFKTVLCKHFGQTGTCSYGDKCQFAHGFQELKNSGAPNTGNIGVPTMMPDMNTNMNKQKTAPNPSNFKIVKCKNWETSGTCKYGSVCTFAHGDNELRTKTDNNLLMSEQAITLDSSNMNQTGTNPFLMQDPNFIYNMMLQQQMMMGGVPMDYSQMYGGMIGQGTQQTDVNLNDQNNLFFQNPNLNPMQNLDPNYLNYDKNSQGFNNMNNFMSKP